jgi:hypothetical protein
MEKQFIYIRESPESEALLHFDAISDVRFGTTTKGQHRLTIYLDSLRMVVLTGEVAARTWALLRARALE